MTVSTSEWVDVGALEDIPVRGARKLKTPIGCVGVFRTGRRVVNRFGNRQPGRIDGRDVAHVLLARDEDLVEDDVLRRRLEDDGVWVEVQLLLFLLV